MIPISDVFIFYIVNNSLLNKYIQFIRVVNDNMFFHHYAFISFYYDYALSIIFNVGFDFG